MCKAKGSGYNSSSLNWENRLEGAAISQFELTCSLVTRVVRPATYISRPMGHRQSNAGKRITTQLTQREQHFSRKHGGNNNKLHADVEAARSKEWGTQWWQEWRRRRRRPRSSAPWPSCSYSSGTHVETPSATSSRSSQDGRRHSESMVMTEISSLKLSKFTSAASGAHNFWGCPLRPKLCRGSDRGSA